MYVILSTDERYMYDNRLGRDQQVKLEVYEVYNELIRDLQQVPGVQRAYLETEETAETGPHVKVCDM